MGEDLDVDGDVEIIVGRTSGLTVLTTGGTLHSDVWPIELPREVGSWAIGNLDSDTDLEMLGYRTDHHAGGPNEHTMFAYNLDGSAVDGEWPKILPPNTLTDDGSITLADLDDDGIDEIIATSLPTPRLYVFRGDGSISGTTWPIDLGEPGIRHVAVADLDSDADKELVVGVGGHGDVRDYHAIHAYHHDGGMVAGWPYTFDEPSWCGVVVGDVSGNGLPDVAFTTLADEVYALDALGDLLRPAWPVELPESWGYTSIALGDLNADGALEILVAGSNSAHIYALDYTGSMLPGWPAVVDQQAASLNPYINQIHAVGDVDGDGLPEVVVGTLMGPYIFNQDGTRLPGAAPLRTNTSSLRCDYPGAASLSDVDGDDDVELVIAMSGYAFIYDFTGSTKDTQWARYRADVANTGSIQLRDCNKNGIPDQREVFEGTGADCNANGILDECELRGDFDGDGDLELDDHAAFVALMTGGPLATE
jgi:hypothetical protein